MGYGTAMTAQDRQLLSGAALSKSDLENGTEFAPRFDDKGLVTAVAVDADDRTVLMVAYMNEQSLTLSLETGIAHYWSRSRASLWKKGETSGNVQIIEEMRTDCDQDVILLCVRTQDTGANCHTGRKSCFYRSVHRDENGATSLLFDEQDKPRFDPGAVYKSWS